MLSTLRDFLSSCALDQRPDNGGARSGIEDVHRRLASEPPPLAPAPAGLRAAVIQRLEAMEAPPRRMVLAGGWGAAMAAGLALAVGGVALLTIRPAPPPAPAKAEGLLSLPMTPEPVFRVVAGSVDGPLLDQAQKMVEDTRRATRAVVRCLPFTEGGLSG